MTSTMAGAREVALHEGRPNRLTVDLGAIVHNTRVLRELIGSGRQIVAAVKANAYGFGVATVAQVLSEAGVDAFAMVDARDALTLRAIGIQQPMILYGGNLVDERLVRLAETHDLALTIGDQHAADMVLHHGTRALPIFVEIDVGLERLGFPVDEAYDQIRRLSRSPVVRIRGLYTHMHVARDRDPGPYLQWQFERFETLVASLRDQGIPIPLIVAASSDVLAVTSTMTLDGVDVGKWLYGLMPRASELGLRCAFVSLTSRITHIKEIRRTEFLDAAPIPLRPGLRIGVVPIGIADGLLGLGCREVLVRGRRIDVLGSPSIEHCRLDLTGAEDVRVGDEVVFVGSQDGDEITLADLPVADGGVATWRAAIEVRDTVRRLYVR